ncbi:MAG: glucuronate isomerase [Anaerolineales bacterium]|nr:glucuronate isomerase [Anaerolineales bacterium]
MTQSSWRLPPDRYFSPDPSQKKLAMQLYHSVADLPIISPHGHVDPSLFVDPDAHFGSPAELLIIPDHYVFRMFYSQGIPLSALGVPKGTGETDHRKIWQTFAENYHLFHGTPTSAWMAYMFHEVLDIHEKLTGATAQVIYDAIAAKLDSPEFRPQTLFERFNIEALCTTDFASDPLEHHQAIRSSGWNGRILPTFRPDDVIHIQRHGWRQNVDRLGDITGKEIVSYPVLIRALKNRRSFFQSLGATATDTDGTSLITGELSPQDADRIWQKALKNQATDEDAARFFGHMLMESARMSIDDGLVMQVHFGSLRNHNRDLFDRFGPDMGSDIPYAAEFTRNLRPLLNKYGNDPRLTLIVFTLDESTYSRELAPLAGHYPALKLGPPWWFNDSINGIKRYLERVIDTAGIYNTVGFNDDTRSFPSLPARHDLWRRATCDWLANLILRSIVDEEDAREMAIELAYGLAKRAYRLGDW